MKKFFILASIAMWIQTSAQITSKEIDELVSKSLTSFNVPGISVAVVKDGKVIHSKGYGIANIQTKKKVNENTLFGIASNSKAFTTAAFAILVDDNRIQWDDKVVKYLPEFKMYNEYVTQEFTIRDLLTHRSGLGMGAGDLMIWPDGNNFTPDDIIKNLQYLKPTSGFRSKFDYDNLLYIVAGEIIKKVTGKSWAQFVQEEITTPIGMKNSVTSWSLIKDSSNVASPHVPIDNKLQISKRFKSPIIDAAGGIYSSASDMAEWALLNLNHAKYSPNLQKQLISTYQMNEITSPQTIYNEIADPKYNNHFNAYGLGWFLSDVNGYKKVTHTGGLEGMVSEVTLIPELQLGIIVLTNQQSGYAFTAITSTILDSYLKLPKSDYVAEYSAYEKLSVSGADLETEKIWSDVQSNKDTSKLVNLTGIYEDPWLGSIEIIKKNNQFFFKSKRSPQLNGAIFQYKDDTFAIKWNNRHLNADAFLIATKNEKGVYYQFKMSPISSRTDFSYDFQDLNFKRSK